MVNAERVRAVVSLDPSLGCPRINCMMVGRKKELHADPLTRNSIKFHYKRTPSAVAMEFDEEFDALELHVEHADERQLVANGIE